MKGRDIIKIIQEEGLEDYEFCVAGQYAGYIKSKVNTIISWPDCQKFGKESYDTRIKGDAKVAILTDLIV